jgi:hypothetical protein
MTKRQIKKLIKDAYQLGKNDGSVLELKEILNKITED